MRILLALVSLFVVPSAFAAYPFTLDEVIAKMSVDHAAGCDFYEGADSQRKEQSTVYTVQNGETPMQVFQIWCTSGAYNVGSVFYTASEFGGLQQVAFAYPVLNEKDKLMGFRTESNLVNSGMDDKGILGFFAKGRGIADCFESGEYKLIEGEFVLKKFVIDSACDGKVRPKKIVDFK